MNERAYRDQILFDTIARQYSRKDLYPPARNARQMRLVQTLKQVHLPPPIDLLEVGCGAGFSAQYLAGRYRTFTGVDYSQALIDLAQQLHQSPNRTFYAVDFYEFRPPQPYDVIVMIGVLHHMVDIPAALQTALQLLKPGGCLVVNEPQPANLLFHGLRQIRTNVDNAYSSEQEELEAKHLRRLFMEAGLAHVQAVPQGLFSTPFAEVPLKPQWLAQPLSQFACWADGILETYGSFLLPHLTWNVIVSGYKP